MEELGAVFDLVGEFILFYRIINRQNVNLFRFFVDPQTLFLVESQGLRLDTGDYYCLG